MYANFIPFIFYRCMGMTMEGPICHPILERKWDPTRRRPMLAHPHLMGILTCHPRLPFWMDIHLRALMLGEAPGVHPWLHLPVLNPKI